MKRDRSTGDGLNLLLALAEPDDAQRARERLGLQQETSVGIPQLWTAVRLVTGAAVPASVLLWMLQADRPEINEIVYRAGVSASVQRDILRGVPFGAGAEGPIPVPLSLRGLADPEGLAAPGPHGVIGGLRLVTSMRRGRSAAAAVTRDDWAEVAAADLEQPLPGFARWALAIRVDCPVSLRERWSDHPSFAHRMRQAKVVDGPRTYVESWRPALDVLSVLAAGHWAFPARMPEAEAVLRPLVRGSLAGNPETWAVLAQLLPTFSGTAPELIVTAGAIA
ncbi:hypothetical protein OG883_12060 [Streptomyces sp. NBC_01142]|uniref:hypothetical protein n=1 Tax=Streptomyces sp. NBC_01142 TaxID=2975865 RepID=UPI00225AC30D|nr:hypothetical protein [Streptomyces sp. NBC_01142]MCX4820630.1 hypothetical protein [Streptomyces sp. NBC_01142]